MKKSILVYLIAVPIFAFAESATIAKFKKVQKHNTACSDINDKADSFVKDAKTETSFIEAGKVKGFIELMESVKGPTAQEAQLAFDAMKENVESSVGHYMGVVISDCTIRLNGFRALAGSIRNNKISDSEKKDAREFMLKSLKAPRYPTLIAISIDAMLAEEAIKKGIWKISAADKKALAQLRKDIKAFSKDITPKMNLENMTEIDMANAEVLKKKPEFQKIKGLFIEEMEQSLQFRERLNKIISTIA